MTKDKAVRVALYARVSTTGHGQDVNLQVDELRTIAKQRGWHVAGDYVDEGVSGSTESRPALDKMLAAARSGKIDVVAVWRIDRLGRSLVHLLRVLDELAQMNVGFVSVRDPGLDSTTAQGRLLLQILGAFAEFEKRLIQERVQAGVNRAKAAGRHCGRPKRDLDLRGAAALLDKGHSIREAAAILGVPRGTLSRRLLEAGSKVPASKAA